jgi:hypothetical protein
LFEWIDLDWDWSSSGLMKENESDMRPIQGRRGYLHRVSVINIWPILGQETQNG